MVGMIGIYHKPTEPNNLNNHLMSNLEIKGVPKNLKNNFFFEYNDFSKLKN